MKTVIKGAVYYDKESDTVLIPHFTGEFYIVDCDTYETLREVKGRYDDSYINSVLDDYIEVNGEPYYSTEHNPQHIGDWVLLSDISDLMKTKSFNYKPTQIPTQKNRKPFILG